MKTESYGFAKEQAQKLSAAGSGFMNRNAVMCLELNRGKPLAVGARPRIMCHNETPNRKRVGCTVWNSLLQE